MSKLNKSGIRPVAGNVIVLEDRLEEKTAGGIILTDQTLGDNRNGATRGTLVQASKSAFLFEGSEDDEAPQIGDRVTMTRFAGNTVTGKDERTYRLLRGEDITAVEVA